MASDNFINNFKTRMLHNIKGWPVEMPLRYTLHVFHGRLHQYAKQEELVTLLSLTISHWWVLIKIHPTFSGVHLSLIEWVSLALYVCCISINVDNYWAVRRMSMVRWRGGGFRECCQRPSLPLAWFHQRISNCWFSFLLAQFTHTKAIWFSCNSFRESHEQRTQKAGLCF